MVIWREDAAMEHRSKWWYGEKMLECLQGIWRLRDGFISHQDVIKCEHPQHHDVAGSDLIQDEKQISRQSKQDPVCDTNRSETWSTIHLSPHTWSSCQYYSACRRHRLMPRNTRSRWESRSGAVRWMQEQSMKSQGRAWLCWGWALAIRLFLSSRARRRKRRPCKKKLVCTRLMHVLCTRLALFAGVVWKVD